MYTKKLVFILRRSPYGDRMAVIRYFWVISIIIDYDRGHSYERFKKKNNNLQ